MFSELNAKNPAGDAREEGVPIVRANVLLVDSNGARLVRCGWFLAYVRESTYISPRELAHRMERVGWTRRGTTGRIKASAPKREATLAWSFYIVAGDWGESDDDE